MDDITGFSNGMSRFQGPKSEQRRSLKLVSDNATRKSIMPKRNYMSLQSEELEERDIVGYRKSLALNLQRNTINFGIVILIVTYSLFLLLVMRIFTSVNMIIYHSLEGIFILIFVIEIIVYRYAFKKLYFSNKFNYLNSILTGVIILFWLTDIFIDDKNIGIITSTRGCMRLLHIPVILENIRSQLRLKRSLMMDSGVLETDKPNSERIIELLLQIGDAMEDPKFYNDIHYCIKHIASGTLYEGNQKDTQVQEVKSIRKRRGAVLQLEEQAWIKAGTNLAKLKRDSKDPGTIVMTVGGNNKSLEACLGLDFSFTKILDK